MSDQLDGGDMRVSGQLKESRGCLASWRRVECVLLASRLFFGVWPGGGESRVSGQLEES